MQSSEIETCTCTTLRHLATRGLEATLRRVRQSIYWHGMAVDVMQQIANCKACRRDAPEQKKETLLSHAIPNKAWRKVGMDIFTHSLINYLVIVFCTWICYLQQWVGLPAYNQFTVSLPVEWESRVKCQIGEETLETSCRSTTCTVRKQKHDYSWYANTPIQRLLHRSTRSIIPQLDCGRTNDKSNRTEKERKLRRTQYHYNKQARDLPPIKEGSRYS